MRALLQCTSCIAGRRQHTLPSSRVGMVLVPGQLYGSCAAGVDQRGGDWDCTGGVAKRARCGCYNPPVMGGRTGKGRLLCELQLP